MKNPIIIRECGKHGNVEFAISKARPNGKCKACMVDAVQRRRKKVKQMAVEYMGGKCYHCGLVGSQVLFDFHHTDPSVKDFAISRKGHCRSWGSIKLELDKCAMLCANCHRLEHERLHLED